MKPGDLGVALVHIFKFQGERIAELWDMGQPVPGIHPTKTGCFRFHPKSDAPALRRKESQMKQVKDYCTLGRTGLKVSRSAWV